MARIYYDEAGAIRRFYRSQADITLIGLPEPGEFLGPIEIAESANQEALDLLGGDLIGHQVLDGVLCYQNEPVTIAEPLPNPRQVLVNTILSRPAIADDPVLQSALATFLAQFT